MTAPLGVTPYESAIQHGRRIMRDEVLQVLNGCLAGESDNVARDAVWRAIDRVQRVAL